MNSVECFQRPTKIHDSKLTHYPFWGKAPKVVHIKSGSRTGQLPAPQSAPTRGAQMRAR
jgi:hypothetical protein